jgi:SAM-dependent methyltransferase
MPVKMEDIVMLMRGFFTMPVLANFGRLGILEKMMTSSTFTIDDFTNIPNKDLLRNSIRYLLRLDFISGVKEQEGLYELTELGREIFQRCHSFYVPYSYRQYMENFRTQLLSTDSDIKNDIDKIDNLTGSGNTHQRYFLPALSFLKRRVNFDLIADIGCGDGHFLSAVLKRLPHKRAVGIDISETAIDVTYQNLCKDHSEETVRTICSDAFDVEKWSKALIEIAKSDKIVISMWFLIHEISRNKPENVIKYLLRIHELFPEAAIILGDLVRQDDDILSAHKNSSIMPEYLFFHDLSGQGILSWNGYKCILEQIPYQLSYEMIFDEVSDNEGRQIPSAFVWCLTP